MNNLIVIGSANIGAFGFQSYFNLEQKKITFDLTGMTTFNGGGINNVVGVSFSVVGPGGIVLAEVDMTNPQLIPSASLTLDIDIPNYYGMFGFYQIQGTIRDEDDKDYTTALIVKEITRPDGFNNGTVPGKMSIDADCDQPQITIEELTAMVYQTLTPSSVSKAGTLYYPKGTLSDLAFDFTPFVIGGPGYVYTGRYTVNNKSTAQFDLLDGVIVLITYATTGLEKVVDCQSVISNVLCCVIDLKQVYDAAPFSASGKAAKEKLDAAALPLMTAIMKEKSGMDASDDIAQIKQLLNCDCGCNGTQIEPRPILEGGQLGTIINIVGSAATDVSSATVSSTKTFTVKTKNVNVVKNTDTGFSITKTVTSTDITFTITFNNHELASNLLTEIQNDNDLLQLFKNLVGSTNSGISLSGLSANCVVNLSSCNYSLIEPNNVAKTVVSITIDGTVFNAPTGTLLSNISAVQAWLNSLSLGTFAVSLDSGTGTILIQSLSNSHVVTTFILSSGGALTRMFTRTCVALVDVLNAITSYLCSLSAVQVAFGISGKQIASYNNTFAVSLTNILPQASVGSLVSSILDSLNALYQRLNTVGLTCTNVQGLFVAVDKTLIATDGIFGTVGGQCAKILDHDLAARVLSQISSSSDLQSLLCSLTAACSGPVCTPPSNLSAVLSAGSLIINANDLVGADVQIRYRINNSGGTYSVVVGLAAGSAPYTEGSSLLLAQYEVGIRHKCTNGVYSPWISALTNNTCVLPTSLSVVVSGSNFAVTVGLTNPQTKVQVQMTDPNGGITTVINDFSPSYGGTFNIAIPAGVYGTYLFQARAICNDTVSPAFTSGWTTAYSLDVPNPVVNNAQVSASYNLTIADVSDGTGSGSNVFNGVNTPGTVKAYISALTNGTYIVTCTGTVPSIVGHTVVMRLVANNTDVRDTQTLTGTNPVVTLTNAGGSIIAPALISFEIDLA